MLGGGCLLTMNINPYPTYRNCVNSPCLNCRMRDIGCHSVCILYEGYKDDLSILKNKAKENINNEKSPRSYEYHNWNNSYCGDRKIKKYYR